MHYEGLPEHHSIVLGWLKPVKINVKLHFFVKEGLYSDLLHVA